MRRVLIANRGEIARRIARTCHAMGYDTIAVYSDPDADAPHVGEATVAYALGGSAAAESYLAIDKLLAAAAATGADAVHPGYGFLAENADFARAVVDAGLIWIGPSPEAIEAMGSKLIAKKMIEDAGVPTLPSVDVSKATPDAIAAAANDIGYPVLIKASAGGGGKGMRVVVDPEELVEMAEGAKREAAAAFADDTIFLEKYLENPRHIEMQVFGDTHGHVVHLYERECSIQRRHQKVIEEAPSPVVDDDLREALGAAAIAAARAVDYVGAGTVEFLVGPDREFYFLEMNTRLQVEHPVTEEILGLDLVRLQLMVAIGQPLPEEALVPVHFGHAVEARVYAEDPTNDFLPVTGTIHRLAVHDPVRIDAGVESGSEISVHYDPMIAKVIAHAETRAEAALALARALRRMELHGVITNRDLLVRTLSHPEFLAGDIDTGFYVRHDPAELGAGLVPPEARALSALAAAIAGQRARRSSSRVLASVPTGWRNSPSQFQRVDFSSGDDTIEVGYRFGRDGFHAEVDGVPLTDIEVSSQSQDRVVLVHGGVRSSFRVHQVDATFFVDGPDGHVAVTELPRFPTHSADQTAGSLVAPMPGKVITVGVAPGDVVAQGDVLVVIEAMKMEHTVRSPVDGTVEAVHVAENQQVDNGQVLVVVDQEDDATP